MSDTAFASTFYTALRDFLKSRDVDAVEVTYVDDRTEYGGYCETCEYTYTVIDIDYIDSNGNPRTHTYSGDLGELIREL